MEISALRVMPQSFGKNTMSLRPEISGSAVRGNPLNIVGIASSRGLGTRNDNQSQFTEALPLSSNLNCKNSSSVHIFNL